MRILVKTIRGRLLESDVAVKQYYAVEKAYAIAG